MSIREVMGCNEQYHMILPKKIADLLCEREVRRALLSNFPSHNSSLYDNVLHVARITHEWIKETTLINVTMLTDDLLKTVVLCLYKEALQNGPLETLKKLNPRFHELWRGTYHWVSATFQNGSFFFNRNGPAGNSVEGASHVVDFYNNPRNQHLMHTDFSATLTLLAKNIVSRVIHSPRFSSAAEEEIFSKTLSKFVTELTQSVDILTDHEQPSFAASAGAVRVYPAPSAPPPPPPLLPNITFNLPRLGDGIFFEEYPNSSIEDQDLHEAI